MDELEEKPRKIKKPRKSTSPYRTGLFTPKNPHKYIGDIDKITFRSSWEKRVFTFLDDNPYILGWASEPFPIPYMKPVFINGRPAFKRANYYPDIYVEFIDKDGMECRQLIEIKPEKQTKLSKSRKPVVRLEENYIFQVNQAKWMAAEAWAKANGVEFMVATEKSIFR